MASLLRLYPAPWRERYGDEFAELLAARPPKLRDRVDIVLGALDARLHPQVGRAPVADQPAMRDRGAASLIVSAGILLTIWAVIGVSIAGHWNDPAATQEQALSGIAYAAGMVGAFLIAIALLLIASRYDRWIGSAGAVGGVLTGTGLVFSGFGGGIPALVLLGGGTLMLAARMQGRLVGRVPALVIAVVTLVVIGAFLAVAASGWQDPSPLTLLVLYGPAWMLVGLDLHVPAEARLVHA